MFCNKQVILSFFYILVKPFIIKTGLKPIKVKVGEVVQLKLDFRGEPDPVAVWSKESTVSQSYLYSSNYLCLILVLRSICL